MWQQAASSREREYNGQGERGSNLPAVTSDLLPKRGLGANITIQDVFVLRLNDPQSRLLKLIRNTFGCIPQLKVMGQAFGTTKRRFNCVDT